jgi:pimeloyl-ACP methyl ester carboxylesterase
MRPAGGRCARGLALLLLALLPAACGGGGQAGVPPAGSTAVSFPSADGIELEGTLAGRGSVGVVLSHMRPADQTSWWDFAEDLADEGYLVLTYNFRGYCPGDGGGCSQGERNTEAIWQDVLGAVSFIRSRGAEVVVLVGASMGGTASLIAASDVGTEVAVVVTLSAPVSFEGLEAGADGLANVAAGKLFIAGVDDGSAAASAQELYELSPPPKRLEILTTGDHGTDILEGNQSGPTRTLILRFLAQYAGP